MGLREQVRGLFASRAFWRSAVWRVEQIDPNNYAGMLWRSIGPFRGGRALAVAGVPSEPSVFYFGSVDGGVWKTENAGLTWEPLFHGSWKRPGGHHKPGGRSRIWHGLTASSNRRGLDRLTNERRHKSRTDAAVPHLLRTASAASSAMVQILRTTLRCSQ